MRKIFFIILLLISNLCFSQSMMPQSSSSGTYTPTCGVLTNLDSVTCSSATWTRSSNVVTVTGNASVDLTAGGATGTYYIALPMPSNITSADDVNGFGLGDISSNVRTLSISGDVTNKYAVVSVFWSIGTVINTKYVFSYIIK